MLRYGFLFDEIVERLKILALTLAEPWGFRHWCIYLLQVEFILDCILVYVWNHIWWLDKWHREGKPHPNIETALGFGLRKIHLDRLKVLSESTLDVKWLNGYRIPFILIDLLEVLHIDRQILIVLVHLSHFLIYHCSDNI